MDFILFYLNNVWTFTANYGWVLIPFYLFPIVWGLWEYHQLTNFFGYNNRFVLLTIRVPREQEKTPKLMEQVIAGLWAILGTAKNFMEMIIQGVRQHRFALEIFGSEGKTYFGIWLWEGHVDYFKNHIYAQYPDAEIEVLEHDYLDAVPRDAPNDEWNLWSTIAILAKPDAYPIRTYPLFEDSVTGTMVDPLAAYMEITGSLGPGEFVLFQLVLEPVTENVWEADFRKELEKRLDRGKLKEEPKGLWQQIVADLGELPQNISAAIGGTYAPAEKKAKEEKAPLLLRLSPGEQEAFKAMEQSFGKKSFRAQYLIMYAGKRAFYRPATVSSLFGALNQFSDINLNGFAPYKAYSTSATYWFSDRRVDYLKRRILSKARGRYYSGATYILNTEEIATLWHFPDMAIQAPGVPRVSYKKSKSSAELPR